MIHLDHGKDLGVENISCYLLDVTSTESPAKQKKIIEDFKTIDVVINNAVGIEVLWN
jgi:NADP-dependent 3-hydroxy acid dehydrogenase YdfG